MTEIRLSGAASLLNHREEFTIVAQTIEIREAVPGAFLELKTTTNAE